LAKITAKGIAFFAKNYWGWLDPTLLGLAAKSGPKHFQKEPPTLSHVA